MINKTVLRTISIITLIVIMIGACGCMKRKDSGLTVDNCIKYMEDKYGEKFTYIDSYGDYQPNNMLRIIVCSESIPDSKSIVVGELVDDTIVFHDNYVAEMYKGDTFELIQNLVSNVYDNCKVLYTVHPSFLPDSFNGTTDFYTYISSRESYISFSVLLPPAAEKDGKEEKIDELYEALISKKVSCNFNVYYINLQNTYDEVSTVEQLMDRKDSIQAHGKVLMNGDFSIKEKVWE